MQQYIGMRLGRYQIVEQIGQGGMATVCKAYQPSMDRYVAIKILPSHFTEDKSFVGRFTQEARTLARLEHPHILPVHDYGEQEGITYLVMRYVEAGTLKDLIHREGPIDVREAARIVGQVGDALDYGHNQGVVHRDIKPSNVLIDQHGNTFLTDFGIAKLVAETAHFTASGAVIGTPAYMSPEQGMGQPVDTRCDIYSLGVVLYELVTGGVPYQAETPLAVLLKHVNAPLPPPRQIKPDLPPAVERVILKAMAKAPDDRYQTAKEMIAALDRAVAEATDTRTEPKVPVDKLDETVLKPRPSPPPPVAAPGAPPSATPAPSRAKIPWLPISAAVAVLAALLVVALLVLPQVGDRGATPTSTMALPPTAGAPAPAETEAVAAAQPSATPAQPSAPAETEPAPLAPTAPSAEISAPPGWTSWGNANFVSALARQDAILWAGSQAGLVRWNLADGSYAKLGVAEGLASSHINDVLVTDEGVLWVATDGGISRSDGGAWITFDWTDGLDSNYVQTLHRDAAGGLWAGSHGGERGLNYYDGSGWGPPPLPPLPVDWPDVQAIASNPAGNLYVGLLDHGLAAFDGEEWSLFSTDDGLPGQHVEALMWADDTLWVSAGGVVQLDPQAGEIQTVPQLSDVSIYAMYQTGEGDLWFAGEDGALRLQPTIGDWEHFKSAPGALPDRPVTDVLTDQDGVWLSTNGDGVVFYDGRSWEIWATDDEIGGNLIEAIREGPDGALWFAHPGSGLSRYVPQDDVWQSFGEAEGALDWPAPAIDGEGNLWIGDYAQLARYDGQTWQRFSPPELEDLEIWAIEIDNAGALWIVTNGGLVRHDPAADTWDTFTGADHPIFEDIWSILASRDGTVWVGGEEGLIRYDGNAWSAPEASGDAPQFVDDIAEAPDGSLWLAADGELVHLADDRWSYFHWPTEGWLERVAVGSNGIVWVGHDGLGRLDPATGDWQILEPGDGLAHPEVLSIHITPEGVVWVGTPAGVSRYVPPDD
jgi:serine/threonine protein kinase/ligand-binding sensor domain-containing protein